jgi:hypothetical protein
MVLGSSTACCAISGGKPLAFSNGRENRRFNVGGFIDAWWHAVGLIPGRVKGFFADWREFQQLNQAYGLFGV